MRTLDTQAFAGPWLAVIRHGQTDWNRERRIQGQTDIPLNETGRAQAVDIAEVLAGFADWNAVHASPLSRALESARIISDRLGLPQPRISPALTERDYGAAEGLDVEQAHERWPSLAVPDAEPREVLAERAAGEFRRLLASGSGHIAVAHGGFIRAGLSLLTGAEAPRVLNCEVWILREEAGSYAAARLSDIESPDALASAELA